MRTSSPQLIPLSAGPHGLREPPADKEGEARTRLNSSQIMGATIAGGGRRQKVLGKEEHVVPWWKLLLGSSGVPGPQQDMSTRLGPLALTQNGTPSALFSGGIQ